MRAVLDSRLAGYWSDERLYLGSMEAGDVAFRSDGKGWAYWSRDGGTFFVLRFLWETPGHRRLTLELRERLSGHWDLKGGAVRHQVTSQAACDTKIVTTYEIHAGQDVFGESATLLEIDQPISLGTIGERFALKRDLAAGERDPAASGQAAGEADGQQGP